MSNRLITEIPLIYADSLEFKYWNKDFICILLNNEFNLRIELKGIISFHFIKHLDLDCDYVDIVDVIHQYRLPTPNEIESLNLDSKVNLHFITLHGESDFFIVCSIVEILNLA
jgi:hypothetical protein